MIDTFTAIDFETANQNSNSICQTGIVRVQDGCIAEQKSWLSMPPNNLYLEWFTRDIHGISADTTADAPTFNVIWPEIIPFILKQDVVAHNSAFDFTCLRNTLTYYGVDVPIYKGHCTYRLLGSSLPTLCRQHRIALEHHDALSDARACAALFMIAQGGTLKV